MRLPSGYTVRPATQDDVDAMAAISNAYDLADFGRADTAREHLADGFRVPGFDPRRDTWLVLDARGHAAAFATVGLEHPSVVEAFARVHPEHAGCGIGSFLVEAIEARAKEHARDGHEGLVVHNSITSTDAAARRLLDDRGYEPVRFFWHMERSLLRADLKVHDEDSTVVVRPAEDLAEEREARAALDEAFRDHWMVEPWPFEDWREHLTAMSGTVLVALEGGGVVGAVTLMPTSGVGWIEEVGVREAERGRGIGAMLLRHALASLAEAGLHEVRLNVDAHNGTGATRLYERVGMRVRREWLVYEKPAAAG